MQPKTYQIYEATFERFSERIAKINTRCRRVGVPEVSFKIVGEAIREENIDGKQIFRKVFSVEVSGNYPKVDGYQFIGTIQHLDADGNIIRAVPGETIDPKYRDAQSYCDHCRTMRRRIDTFLVRNEATKEVLQIGRNCLADYVNSSNVEQIAKAFDLYLEAIDIAEASEDECSSGGGGKTYIQLRKLLAYAVASVNQFGYISKGRAEQSGEQSTAYMTLDALFPPKNATPKPVHESDYAAADLALAWARGLKEQNPDNDYLWNITVVAQNEYITFREVGLAVSIVSAYQRQLDYAKKQEANANSAYVGDVGARLTLAVQFDRAASFEGSYGTTYILMFRTSAGDCVVWKTSNRGDWETGQEYKIKATVKAHKEYRGTKQTEVSRVAISK